jgi:hypothetical protein
LVPKIFCPFTSLLKSNAHSGRIIIPPAHLRNQWKQFCGHSKYGRGKQNFNWHFKLKNAFCPVRPTQTAFGCGGWVLAHGQSLQPATNFVGDEVTSL